MVADDEFEIYLSEKKEAAELGFDDSEVIPFIRADVVRQLLKDAIADAHYQETGCGPHPDDYEEVANQIIKERFA